MDPPGQVTIGFAFRQCQIGKSRSATEVQPGARQAIADEALEHARDCSAPGHSSDHRPVTPPPHYRDRGTVPRDPGNPDSSPL